MMQGSDHSAGSSKVHAATGNLLSYWLVAAFEELMNQQLLPMLLKPNFANTEAEFRMAAVDESDMAVAIANDTALQAMGLPLDHNEQAKRYGRKLQGQI